jgi:hypothetical protein
MKRRTVLQALLVSPLTALTKTPAIAQLRSSAVYTDSAGRDTKALVPLYDGDTKQGGVSYNA